MSFTVEGATRQHLKGVWHQIFNFRFFFINQFPPIPWVYLSNFYENRRRYSKVVIHRCQRHRRKNEKIVEIGSFSYLLRCCWVAVYTHINDFFLHVHFEVKANWFYWKCFIPGDFNKKNINILIAGFTIGEGDLKPGHLWKPCKEEVKIILCATIFNLKCLSELNKYH